MNPGRGLLHVVSAALALATAGAATAQKVYRCGPDGRIYQQAPCADGQAFDASDARSAEQRKAAQAVARDEAKAAAKFDRQNDPAAAPGSAKPATPARAVNAAPTASQPKARPADKPTIYLAPAAPPPAKTSARS